MIGEGSNCWRFQIHESREGDELICLPKGCKVFRNDGTTVGKNQIDAKVSMIANTELDIKAIVQRAVEKMKQGGR